MIKTELFSFSDRDRWEEELLSLESQHSDIYFHPDLYQLYANYGDGTPECFFFSENDKKALYPFLRNSVNTLGYSLDQEYFDIQGAYGYNGIVTNSHDRAFQESFQKAFLDFCQEKRIIAEFTRFHPLLCNQKNPAPNMQIFKDREVVFVDLRHPIEQIHAQFSSQTKRGIKKAHSNKLEVLVHTHDFPLKHDFMKLYRETMTRVGSSAYLFFNESYFEFLFNHIPIFQFSIMNHNDLIASSICFSNGFYFHYHLGASSAEYLPLRPNNLLFDTMILHAKKSGAQSLLLGGGTTKSPEDSLLKFKSGFSKTSKPFFIGKRIHNQQIYDHLIETWQTRNPNKDHRNPRLLRYRE